VKQNHDLEKSFLLSGMQNTLGNREKRIIAVSVLLGYIYVRHGAAKGSPEVQLEHRSKIKAFSMNLRREQKTYEDQWTDPSLILKLQLLSFSAFFKSLPRWRSQVFSTSKTKTGYESGQ
jgi:hypothetical protein